MPDRGLSPPTDQRQIQVRERLPRDLTWMFAAFMIWGTYGFIRQWGWGFDAGAYWGAWQNGLYDLPPASPGAYLYSPAFAQFIWPLTLVARWLFIGAMSLGSAVTLWWLLRPLGWKWWLPLLTCCCWEIATGNINWIFAVVVALGSRCPWLWAIPALTKITPCVGPLWFLVRGEWRRLFLSVGAIAAVTMVSAALAPDLWREWVEFLLANGDRTTAVLGGSWVPAPVVRIPIAMGIVVIGARRDKTWVIPVAMILAAPVFGAGALAVLAGLVRLQMSSVDPHERARAQAEP